MAKKAGFIKIREYIVSKITAAGDCPVTFPTARELGEIFEVSHPTVLRALKGLIADGYIESCRGGGTVSCPQKNNPQFKIFGCLCGHGTQVFEGRYSFNLSTALISELLQRDECYFVNHIQIEDPNHLQRAIQSASLSGLLLVSPSNGIHEHVEKLHGKRFPVVSIGGRNFDSNPFSIACIDMREYVQSNLMRLFSEGRQKILLIALDAHQAEVDVAVKEACKQAGIPVEYVHVICVPPQKHMSSLVELLISDKVFDGVLFQHTPPGAYQLIAEKMDITKQCRVIAGSFGVCDNMKYTGYVSAFDLKYAAKILIDNFLDQLSSPDAPVLSEVIPYQTVFYKGGNCINQK